jgi:hypothetical protein
MATCQRCGGQGCTACGELPKRDTPTGSLRALHEAATSSSGRRSMVPERVGIPDDRRRQIAEERARARRRTLFGIALALVAVATTIVIVLH